MLNRSAANTTTPGGSTHNLSSAIKELAGVSPNCSIDNDSLEKDREVIATRIFSQDLIGTPSASP